MRRAALDRSPEPPRAGSTGPLAAAGERAALLLLIGTPEEVLTRIVPGDPLGIAARVASELRRRALLLDAEHAVRRALARCARAAASWRGAPPLEGWLAARVAEAVEDVRRCEPEAGAAPGAQAFEAIAAPLGLAPRAMQSACARFNRLPRAEREAFVAIVLEGQPLDQVARRADVAPGEAARRARRGLELFRQAGGRARER